jgi:hypothetical protein
MLRFKCPKCATILTADEAAGREVTPCPKCGLLVRLKAPPAKAPAGPPPAPAQAVRPKAPAAPAQEDPASVFKFTDPSEEAPAAVQPVPPAARPPDDEEDTAPGPRRRRKRRRRKSPPAASRLGDVLYLGVVGVLAALGTGFAITALFNREAVLGLIGYSTLLTLVGVVWLYFMAMEDGMELVPRPELGSGARFILGIWFSVAVLIMFVTALVYFVTNPVRASKPGFVAVLGFVFNGIGMFLLYHVPAA